MVSNDHLSSILLISLLVVASLTLIGFAIGLWKKKTKIIVIGVGFLGLGCMGSAIFWLGQLLNTSSLYIIGQNLMLFFTIVGFILAIIGGYFKSNSQKKKLLLQIWGTVAILVVIGLLVIFWASR